MKKIHHCHTNTLLTFERVVSTNFYPNFKIYSSFGKMLLDKLVTAVLELQSLLSWHVIKNIKSSSCFLSFFAKRSERNPTLYNPVINVNWINYCKIIHYCHTNILIIMAAPLAQIKVYIDVTVMYYFHVNDLIDVYKWILTCVKLAINIWLLFFFDLFHDYSWLW